MVIISYSLGDCESGSLKKEEETNMEVTRSNFSEVLQGLEHVVKSSAFLAIDGEFTGLVNGADVKAFDTTPEYYRKIRDGSMRFLFVQFGLSAFKFDSEQNKWTHNTYNFYIFPRPYNRFIEDPRFTCQSSSIDFLASNGFDFNKVFREGIPYLTQAEEERQRKYLKDQHNKNNQNGNSPNKNSIPPVPIPEEHKGFIAKTCLLIDEFLKSDKEELELERSSAFLRKLLYQTVEEKYAGIVRLDTRPCDGSRVLFVTREGSEELRKAREREKQQRELQELDNAFGFSKVIRIIRQSGKLLIGHNMVLDVCHMLNRFYSPLPEDYSDFKELVRSTFPRVLDTKFLASSSHFKEFIKSTVLGDLYKTLSEPPYEMPVVDGEVEYMSYTSPTKKYHEAGYDAYVTGMCFLAMMSHLCTGSSKLNEKLSSLPVLKPFLNKLMLTRIQDIDHINLNGEDPSPPRDHVFHITFPREWKYNDIAKVFNAFGNVFVSWIDECSAFVALNDRDQASAVMKTVTSTSHYKVVPYMKYQQALTGTRKPFSPTTSHLRRRSQERMQEANASTEQGSSRKRKSSGPARESKFSRRSIDPIMEEDDSSNAGAILSIFSFGRSFDSELIASVLILHVLSILCVGVAGLLPNLMQRNSVEFFFIFSSFLILSSVLLLIMLYKLCLRFLGKYDCVLSHWSYSSLLSATCYVFSTALIIGSLFPLILTSKLMSHQDFVMNPLFNFLISSVVIYSIPMPVVALNMFPAY